MDDPHAVLLSMIEKVEDPQIRATLGYMAGMLRALELQGREAED